MQFNGLYSFSGVEKLGIRTPDHFQIKACIMANHIITRNRIVYKCSQYRKKRGSVGRAPLVRYSMNPHSRSRYAKVSRLFNDMIAFDLDASTFQIINNVCKPDYGCNCSWRWKARCFGIKYCKPHSLMQKSIASGFNFIRQSGGTFTNRRKRRRGICDRLAPRGWIWPQRKTIQL